MAEQERQTSSSDAYRVFQESITAAHRDWQANLAKGHEAFLRSMEAALNGGYRGDIAAEPIWVEAVAALAL